MLKNQIVPNMKLTGSKRPLNIQFSADFFENTLRLEPKKNLLEPISTIFSTGVRVVPNCSGLPHPTQNTLSQIKTPLIQ